MEKNNEEKSIWDEALTTSQYISLETDKMKELVITQWSFEKVPEDSKIAAGKMELTMKVIEEDGKLVVDKLFSTTSKRLLKKLRPILEDKKVTDEVRIQIIKVGESFDTQYSVKEIPLVSLEHVD